MKSCRFQQFHSFLPRLVDFAHREHDAVVDGRFEMAQGEDARAEAVNLLADGLFRQRALFRRLAEEFRHGFGMVAVCVRHGDGKRLTEMGGHLDVDGDAADRCAARIVFLGLGHEADIVDFEDAVVRVDGVLHVNRHVLPCLGVVDDASFGVLHVLDARRDTAADFDPDDEVIVDVEVAREVERGAAGGFVIRDDAARESAAVVRLAVTDHRAAGAAFEVSRREIAIKNLCEAVVLLLRRSKFVGAPARRHGVRIGLACRGHPLPFGPSPLDEGGRMSRKHPVKHGAVRLDDGRDVFRLLHAAFDFKRRDADLHELRQEVKRIEVFRREQEIAGRVSEHVLPCNIYERIRQAAGLGAAAAVAAAAADHAAHEALARVADAERAMRECLDFGVRTCDDFANLRQRKLTRQHDARKAECFHGAGALDVVNRHLRARMERQVRRIFAGNLCDAEILHERGIRTDFLQKLKIAADIVKLFIEHHRVDSDMNVHAAQVGKADSFGERFFVKIVCIGARAKLAACEVHGICASLDSSDQRLPAPSRRQ